MCRSVGHLHPQRGSWDIPSKVVIVVFGLVLATAFNVPLGVLFTSCAFSCEGGLFSLCGCVDPGVTFLILGMIFDVTEAREFLQRDQRSSVDVLCFRRSIWVPTRTISSYDLACCFSLHYHTLIILMSCFRLYMLILITQYTTHDQRVLIVALREFSFVP